MPLRKGREHLQKAATRTGGDFQGSRFFYWEDGETKILRFLTDAEDIITVYVHEMVPTFDGKQKGFVCRQEFGERCELCDNEVKRREKGYGIAVWREEVREGKKIVGYRDVTEEVEVEEDGKKRMKVVPWVGVVAQGPKNFWSMLDAAYDKYGTIRDRDFELMRKGKSTDTQYHLFPNDPVDIPNLDERYAKYIPDLEGLLERMGSQEYYDRWLRGQGIDEEDRAKSNGGRVAKDDDLDEESEFERLRRKQQELRATASSGGYE